MGRFKITIGGPADRRRNQRPDCGRGNTANLTVDWSTSLVEKTGGLQLGVN